jgi:hypothetical protein
MTDIGKTRWVKKKYFTVKARILNLNYAHFYKRFHEQSDEDPFYKKIKDACDRHRLVTKVEFEGFKCPYNADGFWFKSATKSPIPCVDVNGKAIVLDDCADKDASLELCILPYDFITPDRKRLVGVTIKVKSIKLI